MKNLILSILGLLALSGCYTHYDDTRAAKTLQVPPYTESGAQTFGCLVDGVVWANFGATIVHHAESIGSGADTNKVQSHIQWPEYNQTDTTFMVWATYSLVKKGKTERQSNMSFNLVKNGSLKGTHLLKDSTGVFEYMSGIFGQPFSSNARNPFTVVINKDSLAQSCGCHIVSGRFSGTLYTYGLKDSVRISGGVFDVKTIY